MDAENTVLRASLIRMDRNSVKPPLLNFPLREKKASALGWFMPVHQFRLSHSRMRILQPTGCNSRTGTLKKNFSAQVNSCTSLNMHDHNHKWFLVSTPSYHVAEACVVYWGIHESHTLIIRQQQNWAIYTLLNKLLTISVRVEISCDKS